MISPPLFPWQTMWFSPIFTQPEKRYARHLLQRYPERIGKLGTACEYFPSFAEIENYLNENLAEGDMLITMGAGDVVKIGEELLASEK